VDGAGATILLVEDNEVNRDMLARRLEKRGYRVVTAADGAEAVARARAAVPDLVLMDMGLPVLDGWEATRQLRADPVTQRVPVIGLSAHAMAADRDRALAAGADEFDTKPVDFAQLIAKIETLLAREAPVPTAAEAAIERPARLEEVPVLLDFLRARLAEAGAGDAVRQALRLAVDEACSNVIAHGYRGAAGTIRLAVAVADGRAVVTVTDEAPPFDPALAPPPDLDAPWAERRAGGLGWHLIRSVVDEVRHRPAGARGNVLTLVKRLKE
jgi:CheY-like chemotaxis protein/anti-sigma regulatory factor (Ser/Thr protein kinase)